MNSPSEAALEAVHKEYLSAGNKFPPFNSSHEGFAVLKEEVDELWDEVKKNPAKHPRGEEIGTRARQVNMRKEAIQIAAMALRFITDCT